MLSFIEFLLEAADSKVNLHLTHLDEDIFERGDVGAQAAVDFCKSVVEELGKGAVSMTVKWDGAPAIFCGVDPADGKFFVGTKSVFNKSPKVYKTVQDIKQNEKGGKAEKLIVSLQNLSKIGIPKGTVLQGDLLWTTGDIKTETIDGQKYVTAHPNTIVYAWPADSDIAKYIQKTKIGIVFHTTYTGKGDLSTYQASFGAHVDRLKKHKDVWMDDAFFKGVNVAFDETEFSQVMANLQSAEKLIGGFDKLVQIMNSIPSSYVGSGIKTFINSKIRGGNLPNPETAVDDYLNYMNAYWEEKVIGKLKSDQAKEQKREILNGLLGQLEQNKPLLAKAFKFVDHITTCKMIVVNKLNTLNSQRSFVKTKDGFKVTNPEGFVAIRAEKGEAVKFVDRLSFSHFNFSTDYLKGWMK